MLVSPDGQGSGPGGQGGAGRESQAGASTRERT